MPLFVMSPNLPDFESVTRKRSLDEYLEQHCEEPPGKENIPESKMAALASPADSKTATGVHLKPSLLANSPPTNSSPASLTEAGSSTPARDSPSPNSTPTRKAQTTPSSHLHPTQHTARAVTSLSDLATGVVLDDNMPEAATQTIPAKRKRLTPEEKAARDKAEAEKKEERERNRAIRVAEKAREEAAKKARADQRAEQRAAKEAEKAAKVEQKRATKLEKQEEEVKKDRSQLKLNSFFKIGAATSPRSDAAVKKTEPAEVTCFSSPVKSITPEVSVYDKLFKPFFLKENVTLARRRFDNDETTRETKSRRLSTYISPDKSSDRCPLDPTDLPRLPFEPLQRGRIPCKVRDVMEEYSGSSARMAIDLTTESQNTQIRQARSALKAIPMKYISFHEDVRPAYFGTITTRVPSASSLRKLARKPAVKTILPLNYDYDSEAEWQDDDGDGEDVDLDDDEEDIDGDEDMEDFLDDSDDAGPARPAFTNGKEPESVGPCWENNKRLGPNAHMYKFRMEFILDTLEHHSGIDPFSTAYWEPAVKAHPAVASDGSTLHPPSAMAPPAAPADAFQALLGGTEPAKPGKKHMAPLAPDTVQKLRELVLANPSLSRVGTIDLFHSQQSGCSKAQIKVSLEALAEKSGRIWKLKDASGSA